VNAKVQFSLGQLLLTVTLVALCLGVGKWCYIKYVDRVIYLTGEGGLDRDDMLNLYLGRRVSFCGRYQYIGSDSQYQIVWFGREPVAIVGLCADRSSQSPMPDGASVVVTGRLASATMNPGPVVPLGCETWYDEWGYHEANAEEVVPYCINVENASVTPSAKDKRGVKGKANEPKAEKGTSPITSPIIGPV
jgi:hypothetical protein